MKCCLIQHFLWVFTVIIVSFRGFRLLISIVLDHCVDYSIHDRRFDLQINDLYCIVSGLQRNQNCQPQLQQMANSVVSFLIEGKIRLTILVYLIFHLPLFINPIE